jgi:CBS domain-containing protein
MASDVMTHNVVSTEQNAPIGDGIRLMLDHRISGLPVVDGKTGTSRIKKFTLT